MNAPLNTITTFFFLMMIGIVHSQSASGKTLYLWTSGDGTTFSNETYFSDSADVPSIVQHSSGQIVVTYQSWRGGMSSPEWDRIGVRFSNDNGATWTPHQPINVTGFPGSSDRAFDPTITVTSTGDYRLYFSYCPETVMLDSTCDTYSALSTDGINYTMESGQRMDILNNEVIDPAVCFFNGLWYYSNPVGAPPEGARSATSVDALNFTILDTIGESGPGTNWTGNLIDNGTTMRFYGGSDNANNNTIWWNETTDGLNWTGYNWTNVQGSAAKDPGIWKLGNGQYLMIVSKDSVSAIASVKKVEQAQIEVYPNPVSEQFQIHGLTGKRLTTIFSIDGNKLMEIPINSEDIISTSDWKSGIYLISIEGIAEKFRLIKR